MANDEDRTRQLNTLTGVSYVALLIAMAWGNAIGMFLVTAIVLVAMLALTGKPRTKTVTAAAAVFGEAFLVAVLIQQL